MVFFGKLFLWGKQDKSLRLGGTSLININK